MGKPTDRERKIAKPMYHFILENYEGLGGAGLANAVDDMWLKALADYKKELAAVALSTALIYTEEWKESHMDAVVSTGSEIKEAIENYGGPK